MAYNQFPEHPDDSVGGWMLTFFLLGIPVVGFIYLLVLALGSGGSPAKRNFARAAFLWQIIIFVVVIIFWVILVRPCTHPCRTYKSSTHAHQAGRHPNHSGAAPTLLATRTTL